MELTDDQVAALNDAARFGLAQRKHGTISRWQRVGDARHWHAVGALLSLTALGLIRMTDGSVTLTERGIVFARNRGWIRTPQQEESE
ncbi:MAG: hypothetical protein AAF196_09115 [Planctomycetota bacterium]